MRKVFLSVMLLGKIDYNDPTYYKSDDFSLSSNDYTFPLTYIIEENVAEQDSDEIVIITAVQHSRDGKVNNSEVNYPIFKQEVSKILEAKHAKYQFVEIPMTDEFDALTFNRFFKQITEKIQDDDQLYADITFGMKPYSFSMFIAIAYAAKAARNVDVDTIIYAQKFSGHGTPGKRTPEQIKNDPIMSKICDLTGLFYLNSLAGNAVPGQKQGLDQLLSFIIDDK